MTIFYKIARPDGWDFYTGKTINYRAAIGSIVRHPHPNPSLGMCSAGVLHASARAEDCFQGGKIPCSLYRIEGDPVVADDGTKAGFTELTVLEELDPATHFAWRYAEACKPLMPFHDPPTTQVTEDDLALLRQWNSVRASVWAGVRDSVLWASVRASVWASVWAGVWDSVRDSVLWASVRASVGDSVRDSVRASMWDSVGDSVGAYIGWIFVPVVPQWRDEYPYQASVDLWRRGLVPSFNGRVWRLHAGTKAKVVYSEKAQGR